MAGLSHGDADLSYQDIDYAFYLYNGYVYVYEAGVYRRGLSSYAGGDRFQVAVEGTAVKYRQNGIVVYESTVPVTAGSYPLVLDTALFTPGAALSNAVIAGTLVDAWSVPTQGVTWTRGVGVSPSGSNLTKSAGVGWNSGAVSTMGIASGEGYVEFTAPSTSWNWMAGLSKGDSDQSYGDIDYGIYLYNGYVYVYESGQYRRGFSSYTAGARFRVGVESGVVRYRQNGVVFYQSGVAVTAASYPLVLDTALFTPGSTLTDAVIAGTLQDAWTLPTQNVTWMNDVGVGVSGNNLTKTAGMGWNAGAASVQGIASGDGYVEFTAPGTGWNWMAGLSKGDTNQSYGDIDYAIYLYNGYVYVYEGGVYRGGFTSYTGGDRFHVGVEGGVVRYRQNGALLYQSPVPVTPGPGGSYPLVLDTAFLTPGASLTNATIAGIAIQ
jgi:hypothetical protein